jgi:hypothetical protein
VSFYIAIVCWDAFSFEFNDLSTTHANAFYYIIKYHRKATYYRVAGFVEPSEVKRQVIEVHCDIGASDFQLVDSEKDTIDVEKVNAFAVIIIWFGWFHMRKMFLEVIMKIIKSMGGAVLARLHSWGSPTQVDMLYDCGNLHKSNAFLRDVLKVSMILALIVESKASNIDELNAYLHDDGGDVHFMNMCELLKVLDAYEAIASGIRECDMILGEAGRMYLLPYCFALNKSQYGPAIVREISKLHFECPDDVFEDRLNFFSVNGNAYDEEIEIHNAAQKRIMPDGSPTADGVRYSNAYVHASIALRNTCIKAAGLKATEARDTYDSSDLTPDIIAITAFFISKGTFKKVTGRSDCFDFSMSGKLKLERTPAMLKEYGRSQMLAYIPQFKAVIPGGKYPIFPKPIELFDKPVVAAQTAGVNSVAVDENATSAVVALVNTRVDNIDTSNTDTTNIVSTLLCDSSCAVDLHGFVVISESEDD